MSRLAMCVTVPKDWVETASPWSSLDRPKSPTCMSRHVVPSWLALGFICHGVQPADHRLVRDFAGYTPQAISATKCKHGLEQAPSQ
jgi:hypothetical protein